MRYLAGLSILGAVLAAALPAAKPLEFEVASIKPADPGANGSSLTTGAGEGFSVTNMPLRNIITFAYNIRDLQLIGGPGWVGTERYDVIAKTPREEVATGSGDPKSMTDMQRKIRDERLRERTRTLLADRFGLVVHSETKEETVYFLTVAKSGLKMKPVETPGSRQGMTSNGRGHTQGFASNIEMLTNMLTGATGHPVRDKTELTGKYDWILDWKPDSAGARPDGSDSSEADTRPTIFTALQEQLGLRLESGKGPVDLIVIDQVNPPSAN